MYSKFKNLSDDEWLAILKKSLIETEIDGVEFPGFPDDAAQVLFTSLKQEEALTEASTFYKISKDAVNRYIPNGMSQDLQYLDFGCGWGRITRMFIRDFKVGNIHGVDVTPEILEQCKKIMTIGEFNLCKPAGELPYQVNSFDLVTAFSVFSHLSAKNGMHWIKEIHNVMRKGGLLVITTLSSSFLAICRDVANNPDSSDWARMMANSIYKSYPDWKNKLSNFSEGEVLYLSSGGGFDTMADDDYGWAMLPREYIEKNWGEYFDVLDYVDNSSILPQSYVILRNK